MFPTRAGLAIQVGAHTDATQNIVREGVPQRYLNQPFGGPAVDERTPDYLHLHVEELPSDGPPPVEEQPALSSLCRTFTSATGWPIEFVSGTPSDRDSDLLWSAPVDPGEGAAPGHFRIGRRERAAEGPQPQVTLESARLLAADLVVVINELATTQQALWRREAELAAGVPVVQPQHGAFPELLAATGGGLLARPNDPQHLAEQLHSLLVDPVRCRQLGAAGQTNVRARFGAEAMAQATLAVYRKYVGASS